MKKEYEKPETMVVEIEYLNMLTSSNGDNEVVEYADFGGEGGWEHPVD